MSAPAPAPAPASAAAPAAAAAKKSPGSKIWSSIGTVVVILVGLIVLFYVIRGFGPEVFKALLGVMEVLATGLTEVGAYFLIVGNAVSVFGVGLIGFAIKLLVFALLIVGGGILAGMAFKAMKKGP